MIYTEADSVGLEGDESWVDRKGVPNRELQRSEVNKQEETSRIGR